MNFYFFDFDGDDSSFEMKIALINANVCIFFSFRRIRIIL